MLISKRNNIYLVYILSFSIILFILTGCANPGGSNEEITLEGEQLVEQWRFDSSGAINQAPLRAADVVVFVPNGGKLTAVDAATGQLRWEFGKPAEVWERAYATNGESVFAGLEGGKFAAIDLRSGKVRWEVDLGINVQVAPLVAGEVLYIPTTFVGPKLESDPEGKAKLFVLSIRDGKELWSFETDNYILQTPTYFNDVVYVGGSYYAPEIEVDEGGPMRIYALDAESGMPTWVYEEEHGFIKKMYATESSLAYIAYQDYIFGVDVQTGEMNWRRDTGNWVPSLMGTEDTLYFGSANTIVYALDANSGEVRWQQNIPEGTFNYLMGAPVRVQNDLYFLTQHGDIMALNALNGEILWHIPTGVTPREGLTVSGGWLYFGDIDGTVYGYSTEK